jgi:crossover junction endodeoxyribonuclease RuvC
LVTFFGETKKVTARRAGVHKSNSGKTSPRRRRKRISQRRSQSEWHNPQVPTSLRILGIDPGLNRTGYGVIDVSGSTLQCVDSGIIRVPAGDLYQRLGAILELLGDVIRATQPHVATVEKVFVNVNPQSTLLLGQARGAAICAAASSGLVVHEYAALQIKQAVVGFGQADKKQVQTMVQRLLGLARAPAADAADALACAICHAHSSALLAAVRASDPRATAAVASAPRRRGGAAGRRTWTVRLQGAK